MVRITKDGEQVLREIAQVVPLESVCTAKIQKIIANMSNALSTEKFGVAIAAPQINESVRIFVVKADILKTDADQAFINPIILKTSKKIQSSQESCLSVQGRPAERGPDVAGVVQRPKQMTISYIDATGAKKERGASGFLAAIFDHEIDHLNGTLFIDKAEKLWEIDADFNKV